MKKFDLDLDLAVLLSMKTRQAEFRYALKVVRCLLPCEHRTKHSKGYTLYDQPFYAKVPFERHILKYPYPYFQTLLKQEVRRVREWFKPCYEMIRALDPLKLEPIRLKLEKVDDTILYDVVDGNHRIYALCCVFLDESLDAEIKARYPSSIPINAVDDISREVIKTEL